MVLSKMQKTKLIFALIITIFCFKPIAANNWYAAWKSYLAGTINKSKLSNTNQAILNDPYYLTLSAIYKKNADESFKLYKKALQYSKDKELTEFINDKIADYYYASGLYVTAKEYRAKKNEVKVKPGKKQKQEKINADTYLQFGVFSSKNNAQRFIRENKYRDLQFIILSRNNKYYVVTGPYFSKDEAKLMQSDVKTQHRNLKPFVKRF